MFLCDNHREQLNGDLPAAVDKWSEWMLQAENCQNHGNLRSAMTYLGCAHELGEMLVEAFNAHEETQELRHIDRYMIAGIGLIRCLGVLGEANVADFYRGRMQKRLSRETARTPALHHALDDWFRRCGTDRGYAARGALQ